MSSPSVNTNPGAMAALQGLASSRLALRATERRLATGLAVERVTDNPATWQIAQGQRGIVRALDAVTQSLQRMRSGLDVAGSAAAAVHDLLLRMKATALAATDGALEPASRTALDDEFRAMRDQITRTSREATFGGIDLIGQGASDQTPLFWHSLDTTPPAAASGGSGNGNGNAGGNGNGNAGGNGNGNAGGNGNGNAGGNGNGNAGGNGNGNGGGAAPVALPAQATSVLTIRAASLALGGPNVTVTSATTLTTVAAAAAALAQVTASLTNVAAAEAGFGAAASLIERHLRFVGRTQDVLRTSIGGLVDADLGRESARLRADRAREALAARALAIANAAPAALLPLFRGASGRDGRAPLAAWPRATPPAR